MLNFISSLANLAFNTKTTVEENKKQLNWSKEQFDWQKQQWQTELDRQDSAYQRAVSDAMKAGISPLAVSGGAASNAGMTPVPLNTSAPRSNIQAASIAESFYRLKIMRQELENLKDTGESIKLNNARMANDNKYYEESGLPSNSNSTERMVSDIVSYLVKQNPKGRLSDVPSLPEIWNKISGASDSVRGDLQTPRTDGEYYEQMFKRGLERAQEKRDSEHQLTLDRLNSSNGRSASSERDSQIRFENDDNYKWYLSHKNAWTKDVMREWYSMSGKQKRAFNNDMKEWFYWRTHSGSKSSDPKR